MTNIRLKIDHSTFFLLFFSLSTQYKITHREICRKLPPHLHCESTILELKTSNLLEFHQKNLTAQNNSSTIHPLRSQDKIDIWQYIILDFIPSKTKKQQQQNIASRLLTIAQTFQQQVIRRLKFFYPPGEPYTTQNIYQTTLFIHFLFLA